MLPLNYIYKQDIFDALIKVFVEHEKNTKEDRISYRDIYRKIIQLVGHQISFRDFETHVEKMVDENILHKDDPTGKRGAKVYFSLTDKAKTKYSLKILGIDDKVQKRKSLYQLLIFFEAFKRRDLLSERQLDRFLRQIGVSRNKMEEINTSDANIRRNTVFEPIKGVEIVKLIQSNSKTASQAESYYAVIPGFTVKELYLYLKKLKKR